MVHGELFSLFYPLEQLGVTFEEAEPPHPRAEVGTEAAHDVEAQHEKACPLDGLGGEAAVEHVPHDEVDHLDGKLFVDYISEAKRQRIRKRLLRDKRHQSAEAVIL